MPMRSDRSCGANSRSSRINSAESSRNDGAECFRVGARLSKSSDLAGEMMASMTLLRLGVPGEF